ncbi:MAG: hypothetical protein N2037_05170, partial [Acidimicrobiales bacterium]|nr:hypothetical protein [Acidimicrobiales bacterium]
MRDSHGANLPRILGIPDEAERVLVVTESSHWDPNWLLTSEEYYRWRVRRTLDAAIDELLAEPTRVYSVECVFFFRLYWERNPHRHEAIRELVAQRRLRFTGPGVTTPDTLLPTDEALLRDLAIGQAWLHDHELTQEPEVLYLPDSFGHTPCLPTLLRAAGLRYACVTRIDGMYMDGTDWEPRSKFPRPGSLAERLWSTERSLDFVWRDPWGSEALAHWHAFTYGQGDLLAGRGISRWMGLPLWVPDRSDRNVVKKVEHFAQQLTSRSRTRYLCCPIGFDFVNPVHRLSELIARWNDRHYGHTGLWLLNAGLDDYFHLIELHQSELPVIDADPNPYWTGFYSARPKLKQVHARLVDALLATEVAAAAGGPAMLAATAAELGEPWYVAAVANHHDFVTGTSPNRVARREQYPWLDDAGRRVASVRSRLPDPVPQNAHADVHATAEGLEERLAHLALCLIAWE